MKYLGIDYGSKKIGLALSDERGKIAFPHSVISNDEHAVSHIAALIKAENVGDVVAGDTRTQSGKPNDITEAFFKFLPNLATEIGMEIALGYEHGTTGAVQTRLPEGEPRGTIQSPRKAQHGAIDAHAAALILQRYLDGMPKNGGTI